MSNGHKTRFYKKKPFNLLVSTYCTVFFNFFFNFMSF